MHRPLDRCRFVLAAWLPLLLTWLLLGLAAWAPPAQAASLEIRSALSASALQDHDTAFPEGSPTTLVALPDEWARSRPGRGGPVWYRVQFQPMAELASDDLMALFIEHVCSSVDIYLNGQLVHSTGRMVEPLSNNCNHPQLVTLPGALIKPGGNLIDLKVAGYKLGEMGSRQRAGALSALSWGRSRSWRCAMPG